MAVSNILICIHVQASFAFDLSPSVLKETISLSLVTHSRLFLMSHPKIARTKTIKRVLLKFSIKFSLA